MQHACNSCGHDLNRVRAVPDATEGLPVVICPGCEAVTVRRPDPLVTGFRRCCRAGRAGMLVGLQCFVFATVTALAVMVVGYAAGSALQDYGRNPLRVLILEPAMLRNDQQGPVLLVLSGMLLLIGLFAGAWARSALAHLPGWRVWLVWSAIVAGITTLPGWLHIGSGALPVPPRPLWGDSFAARSMTERLTMSLVFALFMLLGMPLGRTIRGLWSSGQQARRSKVRRNRRRLRENR